MLSDDRALNEVALGAGGVVESLPLGGIRAVMETHQIETIRALAAAHHAARQVLVAAPVLGRPAVAAAGRLGIIVAGPRSAINNVRPLFKAIGRRIFKAGKAPEAASLLKLCNNMVLACAIESLGEAFSLVEKSGVDKKGFQAILTGGRRAQLGHREYHSAAGAQGRKPRTERSWVAARAASKCRSMP